MISMQLRITPLLLFKYISDAPHHSRGVLTEAASVYLLESSYGLKHYPPENYVSRERAYGQTFFTDRQRRWFWWSVGQGTIAFPARYARTFATRNAWVMKGERTRTRITNNTVSAMFTMSDDLQAAQPRLVGWRTVSEVIEQNEVGMVIEASKALDKWLRERGI